MPCRAVLPSFRQQHLDSVSDSNDSKCLELCRRIEPSRIVVVFTLCVESEEEKELDNDVDREVHIVCYAFVCIIFSAERRRGQ